MIEVTDKRVRSFGYLFAFIGIVLIPALIFWKRGEWTDFSSLSAVIGLVMGLEGRFDPKTLRPLYIGWMKLAMILNWIMTRLIISFVFFLLMTPIGLIRRIGGSKTSASFHKFKDSTVESYWIQRDPVRKSSDSYSRQF